jgi:hypothetical protein
MQTGGMGDRPDLPPPLLTRLRALFEGLPECVQEAAWTGVRWRVAHRTVAHAFGGEDQRFRITFRAEAGELLAFEHLGPSYFRSDWGGNVVGVILDESTDWGELAEFVLDSYCLQAPARLADAVQRPPEPTGRRPGRDG